MNHLLKEDFMLWIPLGIIVGSALLIKFGSLIVTVAILEMALKAVLALLLIMSGLLAWRWN